MGGEPRSSDDPVFDWSWLSPVLRRSAFSILPGSSFGFRQ